MARSQRTGMGLLDRLVLLVAWIVTCGLVYVLGLYVGKGTQEQRLGLEERVVRLPVTSPPPPEGQRPKGGDELTFYETLVAGSRAPTTATRGTPTAAPEPVPSPAAARDAVPAMHQTVTAAVPAPPHAASPPAHADAPPLAAAPVAPHVAPPPPPHAAVPPPHPTTPAPPAAGTPPAAAPPATVAGAPRPPTRAGDTPVAASPPAAVASAAGHPVAPAPPRAGGWTVQANPTRSHDEAEAVYQRLRAHGYEASLVRVLRDGDTWYRVQVGRFTSSGQATEMMQRLREHEGVSHAFVASE